MYGMYSYSMCECQDKRTNTAIFLTIVAAVQVV